MNILCKTKIAFDYVIYQESIKLEQYHETAENFTLSQRMKASKIVRLFKEYFPQETLFKLSYRNI